MEKVDITVQRDNTQKEVRIAAVLMAILALCCAINSAFVYLFLPFIILFSIIKLKKTADFRFDIADMAIVIICITESLLTLCSQYSHNSILMLEHIMSAIVVWFFFRICLDRKDLIRIFIFTLSCIAFFLAVLTLLAYIRHRFEFKSMGFNDMTLVRQYYHPLGDISNDWVAVLLCLIPLPIYSYVHLKRPILKGFQIIILTSIITSILISFSRGAYIAFGSFCLSIIVLFYKYGRRFFRRLLFVLTVSIGISLISVLPDSESVLTTCAIMKNTTQIRSVEGRVEKMSEAKALYKDSPVTGVGGGNYRMTSGLKGRKDFNSSSFRSANSYFQMLVEKGWLGTTTYALSFLLIIVGCLKIIKKRPDSIPFVAALFALSVRELFFSTFFEDDRFPLVPIILLLSIIQMSAYYERKSR